MATTSSTQDFLEVEEIKEGVLVLKDNTVRGVLLASSQNFALKSDDEQQAIIYQFQNFLNSLDFPTQIVIQSRRLNITGYIESLKTLEQQQQNKLLKIQTADYRQFVEQLIKGGSIMAKNFFVAVPFSRLETTQEPGTGFRAPKVAGRVSDEEFERMRNQLWQRMEFVALGLRRAGIQSAALNTEELIELLWSWHHPAEAEVGYYPEIPPEVLK
ncbi:MAG: hypothetical protein HYS60_01165 [Candidatus Wildermuthbacteria bacterium]|nr:hypothetical protein [Candidatus Wildermuthbacteria bacterium]